jgi:hypothetical protein
VTFPLFFQCVPDLERERSDVELHHVVRPAIFSADQTLALQLVPATSVLFSFRPAPDKLLEHAQLGEYVLDFDAIERPEVGGSGMALVDDPRIGV